jgi:Flp pilus assembly protein TadB
MQNFTLRCSSALVLASLTFAVNMAFARDISNEQRAASDARDVYNQAKSVDNSLTQQIADQEKRVTAEQTRLDELKNKQLANKAALKNAEVDLNAKVMTLEKVWDERNKR